MPRLLPVAAVLVFTGCGGSAPGAAVEEPEPTPAFVTAEQPAAAPVKKPAARYRTAHVERRTTLRSAPGGNVLARIGRRTEFGSARVLGVVGQRGGWVRVIASERENGRYGWVRAGALRLGGTNISIRVDRSARRLVLRRGDKVLRRMPIAVGRPGNETPLGRFAVTDRLHTSSPDSPYGCCAVALSGHQTKLEPGWPGGDRLAIHGTPNPETVGTEASLGCMRAHTNDIRALIRRVPLGAPVFVRA